VTYHTRLLEEAVDIQTPATLFAKLDYLRHFDGMRVVLLGDSVVYGGALGEHGDRDWRQRDLSALLRQRLDQAFPGRRVCVMNLGMNGALPADVEQVGRLLRGCPVDLWIMDVGLRSFSSDFCEEGKRLSRPWLADLDIDAHGSCYFRDASNWFAEIEARASALALNHCAVYRLRDFLQARAFNLCPADSCRDLRDRANRTLQARAVRNSSDDDLVLLLKARQRLSSISLEPDHPQRQALERLLAGLRERGEKVVVFYARENPDVIDELIDRERYARLSAKLCGLIESGSPENIAFVPGVTAIPPECYLDHVHVDARGYQILVDHLWMRIRPMLPHDHTRLDYLQ